MTVSTDQGWWARRLGGQPAQAHLGHPQNPYPPTQYQPQPAPSYAPQPPQYVQNAPGVEYAPPGQMNIMDAVQRWQGGPAHRQERMPCPMCGSSHYFSRVDGITRGPAPAPLCYACGYNGMHMQGDPAVWGAT